MTTGVEQALILQGEILCSSVLGLKGLIGDQLAKVKDPRFSSHQVCVNMEPEALSMPIIFHGSFQFLSPYLNSAE